jgi:hypothetical protein
MIEIVEGFPENVVGILAKGQVTRKDYLEVVIPAIDKALKRNTKLRLTTNWVRNSKESISAPNGKISSSELSIYHAGNGRRS